ncbi:MAG: molecular chaperone DnaJ [Bacteroidales bacterium]|nr:molecular chaperone DnaJ [Bacteroidales bacterium]
MKLHVNKQPKVALCRRCKGSGYVDVLGEQEICPQCKGSGRVVVSCTMDLTVVPWTPTR